ncbi:MAG: hypothetical protein LBR51_04545 [Bacteroidales bacterium]|jgi:hypothetical protein|nr:hypothetical protein [Bacteroidales bacterium]
MDIKKLFLWIVCLWVSWGARAQKSIEPYPTVSGFYTGAKVAASPDPLVGYRWASPAASDNLEIYTLIPESIVSEPAHAIDIKDLTTLQVKSDCSIRFDFGRVSAAWFEFDSRDLPAEVEIETSISEYNEPAIVNAGAQHPEKTARPVKYGNTYRLELNDMLYEGVRFAWIHIKNLKQPAILSRVHLVCQVKPTHYEGSFSCNDSMLTRIWYTGAYTVKLNLLHDYFGAILMERSDRHSWTGDAHPSQAAALVAFGNYDFIKTNIFHTARQANGIASYALYWALSLRDYYYYSGDEATLEALSGNLFDKLDRAYAHYDSLPYLSFYGWDERLGAGFENPHCLENQRAYRMLCIAAWTECSQMLRHAGYTDMADKYAWYALWRSMQWRFQGQWWNLLGTHAAADAINAGFATPKEEQHLWKKAFANRQDRISYSPFNQYFIIKALAKMGRYGEALNTIDDCWGGQIRYGGTTFFEVFRPSWNDVSRPNDAPVNNQCGYSSMTHPWSAGITRWLSEEILGISPMEPGFKKFAVHPHLSEKITWVKGDMPTPHGTIHFEYDRDKGEGILVVPDGCEAYFQYPEDETKLFLAGTHILKTNKPKRFPKIKEAPLNYALGEHYFEDDHTSGDWHGHYGKKGYLLCNFDGISKHREHLPDFVSRVVFLKNDNILYQNAEHVHWTGDTTDRRALQNEAGSNPTRRLGAITTRDPAPCYQTMTIDIHGKKGKFGKKYQLSLYFVDWEKVGRRSAIEVFDLETKQLLKPIYMVRDYENGKYVSFSVDRPTRVRINQVRGKNAALSGLFFD